MLEREFTLDGVTWGHETSPIVVDTADLGGFDVRDQDTDRALDHGATPGYDRLGATTWVFNCFTNASDLPASLALHRALAGVWRRPRRPGELAALRFTVGGRSGVVFGRPRQITLISPDEQAVQGAGSFTMSFKVLEPAVYDDALRSVRLTTQATASGAGLSFPHRLDETFIFGSLGTVQQRTGQVVVGGEVATPFTVLIHGPITNPSVTGGGISVKVTTALAADRSLTVDTRAGTATWDDGTDASPVLSYDTRLRADLPPGATEFVLSGTDPTATAYAEVSWRDAHAAL